MALLERSPHYCLFLFVPASNIDWVNSHSTFSIISVDVNVFFNTEGTPTICCKQETPLPVVIFLGTAPTFTIQNLFPVLLVIHELDGMQKMVLHFEHLARMTQASLAQYISSLITNSSCLQSPSHIIPNLAFHY